VKLLYGRIVTDALLHGVREYHDLAGRISTKEGKFCEIVLAGDVGNQ